MLHKEREEGKECGVERTWAGASVIVTRGAAAMKEIWCGANWRNRGGMGTWKVSDNVRNLEYPETKAGALIPEKMCTLISVSTYCALELHGSIKQRSTSYSYPNNPVRKNLTVFYPKQLPNMEGWLLK